MGQARFYASSAFPTTLTANLGSTGNPQVASIAGLPTQYPFGYLLEWGTTNQEVILVTSAPTGTGPFTLPCTRGADGTTAQSHSSGAPAVHGVSAEDFTQWSAFIDSLTGTAASNFLPQLAVAAASASATLAVNTLTQVTAASNLTMTLPSPVAGALIVVEREAASAGTVAVTGNIRGAGSSTVTLSLASESEAFLGTASTWDPVAGHKTLGSLQALFAEKAPATDLTVYVSKHGNDSSDGLSPGSAKLTVGAALGLVTSGGVVNLGPGTWNESGLALASAVTFRGAGSQGTNATKIQTGASGVTGDLFAVPSNCFSCVFEDICLVSNVIGGGHIFNASTSSVSGFIWQRCSLIQDNDAKCIWFTTDATFINCTIRDCYSNHTTTATVPSWWLVSSSGGLENNTWENIWHTSTGSYYVLVNSTSASTFADGMSFRNFVWEQCCGGFVKLLGCRYSVLENMIAYDNSNAFATIANDGYYFGRGTTGNLPCWAVDARNLIRLSGGFTRTDTGSGTAYQTASGSTTVSDASAIAADLGRQITNANIPPGALITSVTPGTGYVISVAATANATGQTFVISAPALQVRTDFGSGSGYQTTISSTTVADASAVSTDIGRQISNANIPAGATITSVTPGTGYTISAPATASATGQAFVIQLVADIRFFSAARSKVSGCGGAIDLNNTDVATYDLQWAAQGTTVLNRSPVQSLDISPINGSVFPSLAISGLTSGTAAASRWVGGTASGAPASGAHLAGDFSVDQSGKMWICTAAGTPGTWASSGVALDATSGDIQPLGTQAAGSTGKAADAGHVHPTTSIIGGVTVSGTPSSGFLPTATSSSAATWQAPAGTSVIGGVTVSGTPVSGNALTATSGTAANWQTPAAGVTLDTTATDIQPDGTQAAGSTGKAADAGHVHPGFFQQFTSSGSATVPAGTYEIAAVGAGGGGAGGGSASGAVAQAGGGGGGSGATSRQVFVLGSSVTLTVTIGTGGAGGAGAAANGAAGSNGTSGASTTVTGTGVSVAAIGGSAGRHPSANLATAALGGAWGTGTYNVTNNAIPGPGMGQPSAAGGFQGGGAPVDLAGGGGGGGGSANTSTAGGGAGGGGTATAGGTVGADATSGSTAGGTASAATAVGAGGGGGGGGAQTTGAGGAGGAGGPGYATIRRVA